MIDTLYQAAINRNLDDQVVRPSTAPEQGPSTFTGFWRGLGGIPGGAALGFGSFADVSEGTTRVDLSQGLLWNPGTRSYVRIPQDGASRADAAKIASGHAGDLFTSETGDTFRGVAKSYMPDAKTTGAAGQVLANGLGFLTQAGVAMSTSGPVIGAGEIGAAAGMQESDRLREQGVDQRTREQAGAVVGLGTGASMFLPMAGPSALVRFGKGAVGGAVSYAAQTEVEKLVLQHAGYDKLAQQYDPLDPVGLAISAGVPGVLGAALGHTAAGRIREPNAQDLALTPAEQAHSDAVEASTVDVDIVAVKKELATQKDAGAREILQAELDKLLAKKQGGEVRQAIAADPNLEPAARVQQTARAIDESRLTPDDDLAGHDLHQQAVERAFDQLGAGEPVEVSDLLGGRQGMQESRDLADQIDTLEAQREQLLSEGEAKTSDRITAIENDLAAAREQQAALPGPATTPRRLAVAMQDVYQELGRTPAAERTKPNHDAFHAARAEAEAAKAAGAETSSAPSAPPPRAAETKVPAAGPTDAHLDAAVAALDPEMMVHMEGLAEPMRLGDLMDSVREQAARDGKDSRLLEVAAQCAISVGSAG